MTHKTTAFFNRNYLYYGAQDKALRQRGATSWDWKPYYQYQSHNPYTLW